MRVRWAAGMLCTGLAMTIQVAMATQMPSKTVIDGRTFDFVVPDMDAPDFYYRSIYNDFLIGALNTRSPPKQIWQPFDDLMRDEDARAFVVGYLKSRPAPTPVELEAFLARVKAGMIFVDGGTFDMGDYGWLTPAQRPMTPGSAKDTPHKVTLDSYSLMKNMVTYAEYDIYSRANHVPPIDIGIFGITRRFPNYPAFVTWQQGRDYCQWLDKITHQPFDIDTSAQYEYAARSGGEWLILASTFEKRDELVPDGDKFYEEMHAMAERDSIDPAFAAPVGTFGPNYLGFEDMVGPAEEWVYDWYGPYTKDPLVNPRGPKTGTERVVRTPKYSGNGTINRWKSKPDYQFGVFRCAINSNQPWK